jgi:hypothetical protein
MRKILSYLVFVLPALAGDPWRVPSSEWTDADARRVLSNSPWAQPVEHSAVTVRWESARPVQLAMAQLQQKTAIGDDSGSYAVAVVGVEMPSQRPNAEASLKATGRKALAAIGLQIREDALIFRFPRTYEIQQPVVFRFPVGPKVGDTVEFETRIGNRAIRQKFLLRRMNYDGRLEL